MGTWVSTKEAAAILGCSQNSFQGFASRVRMKPYVKKAGRIILVDAKGIMQHNDDYFKALFATQRCYEKLYERFNGNDKAIARFIAEKSGINETNAYLLVRKYIWEQDNQAIVKYLRPLVRKFKEACDAGLFDA